jgi:diaminopimelate epimerase
MSGYPFVKMHGLGNDFVVLDARARAFALEAPAIRAIADRKTGVGCDQLIVIEPPGDKLADAFMRIRNADGSEVQACGNATRCVATLLMAENGTRHAVIQTVAGLLDAEALPDGRIAVDMGPARLDWREIPLAKAQDTLRLDLAVGTLAGPVAVNMGNPHAVFFVDDVAAVPVEDVGPAVEKHPLFPEYTNVEFVQVLDRDRLRMRVWERGTGVTRACGSGACASLVAAARRGLADRSADVLLDGGILHVEWLPDGHVLMTGPALVSFRGTLEPALLAEA